MRNLRRSAVLTVGAGKASGVGPICGSGGLLVASSSGWSAGGTPALLSAAPKSNEKFPNSAGSKAGASSDCALPGARPLTGGAEVEREVPELGGIEGGGVFGLCAAGAFDFKVLDRLRKAAGIRGRGRHILLEVLFECSCQHGAGILD